MDTKEEEESYKLFKKVFGINRIISIPEKQACYSLQN